MPASTSACTARSRCSGCAVPGSSVRHASSSTVGTLRYTVAARARSTILQHVDVAHDHRALGHEPDRRAAADQRLQRAARELVVPFDRLIRIGRRAERRQLARPARMIELAAQHLDEVRLDEDHRRKLVSDAELELRLVAAREAVVARVRAAAVRVQRPLERHPLDGIQRRAAADFLVASGVGAPLRFGERLGATCLDDPRDVARGQEAAARGRTAALIVSLLFR